MGWVRGPPARLVWIIQWLRLTNKGKSLHGKRGPSTGEFPKRLLCPKLPFSQDTKISRKREGTYRLSLFQSPFRTEMQNPDFVLISSLNTFLFATQELQAWVLPINFLICTNFSLLDVNQFQIQAHKYSDLPQHPVESQPIQSLGLREAGSSLYNTYSYLFSS